jgi:hypothetical protein
VRERVRERERERERETERERERERERENERIQGGKSGEEIIARREIRTLEECGLFTKG